MSQSQSSNSLQLAKPMASAKVVASAVARPSVVADRSRGHAPTAATSTSPAGGRGGPGGPPGSSVSGGAVDFVGPSHAVRRLFSLPYSSGRNVSVALHNVGGGTLLLDSGEDIAAAGAADAPPAPALSPRTSRSGLETPTSRRRQRPLSWSASKTVGHEGGCENELDQARSQLAQLREEKSLLASLSMLLEEEKRQQQHHHSLDNNIVSEGESSFDGEIVQAERDEKTMSPVSSTEIVLASRAKASEISTAGAGAAGAGSATTAQNKSNTMGDANNIGNNDPLAGKIPPPQYYLRHVVAPPTKPRQHVEWEFRDMKMLVASDAVIYNAGDGGGAVDFDAGSGGPTPKSEAIAIRVADASDLRSQMHYHETMVKEGLFAREEGIFGRQSQIALPPSSYAEVLKLTPSSGEGASEEDEENTVALAEGMDENVKLQTSLVPATGGGVGPEWAQLGFSISMPPPPTASAGAGVEDVENATAVGSGEGNSASSRPGAIETNASDCAPPPLPVCTVLDAYLDNLMANVPQLALILREHGFIQNIKLLRTEEIPSLMMHPSTLGVDSPAPPGDPPAPIFDPDIVEMNAAMLLRFLKANCSRENSTYLLRRAADATEIQLFDITSISERRVQRKWVWWLALCSYRFACRLEQLQADRPRGGGAADGATRRDWRDRKRSLLRNTLDLLEELADMDDDGGGGGEGRGRGGRHGTISAAVCEHLADTYLGSRADDDLAGAAMRDPEKGGACPAPTASSSQPYRNVTVDCLDKAHDHLANGVKKLMPLLAEARQKQRKDECSSSMEVEAISTQLYGIYHKVINVCLRLADQHLKNYFSSNLIRSLRTAARTLSVATSLLRDNLDAFSPRGGGGAEVKEPRSAAYARTILLQHAWLWEYCGHFARSFAADGLWRDRGHTCGADLVGLLWEVDESCAGVCGAFFGGERAPLSGPQIVASPSAVYASHGQVSFHSLSGVVVLPHDFERIEASVLQKEGCHEAIGAARAILGGKTQIQRDARQVLVAACICYGHAIDSYAFLAVQRREGEDDCAKKDVVASMDGSKKNLLSITPGRSGDSPSVVAPLLRQRLGDACNEIGKILLKEARNVLLPQFSPPCDIALTIASDGIKSFGMSHVSAIMLASAQFWFVEGLARFTEGKDVPNLALLRCNLCQCCKIRANTNVILPGSSPLEDRSSKKKKNSEYYLQEAVDHLVAAHDGKKKVVFK